MNNRMRHFVLKLMCDDAGCEDISELAGFAFYRYGQDDPVDPDDPIVPDEPEEPDDPPYGYIYGGYVLPKAEWDEENYPYAFIVSASSLVMYVSATPFAWHESYDAVAVNAPYGKITYDYETKTWGELTLVTDNTYPYAPGYEYAAWSNRDITKPDGSLSIKGTEPEPFYLNDPDMPTAFLYTNGAMAFQSHSTPDGNIEAAFVKWDTEQYSSQIQVPWYWNYATSIGSVAVADDAIPAHTDYWFYYCTNLHSASLPEGLKSIGGYMFSNTKLAPISIPSTVEEIGERAYAFLKERNETPLQAIIVPEKCKKIGDEAFMSANFSQATSVSIGAGCEEIGRSAFYNNPKIKWITIGESVKRINPYAFYRCGSNGSGVNNYDDHYCKIEFKNTEGWWVSTDANATEGTAVDVSDMATTAKMLAGYSYGDLYSPAKWEDGTHVTYYWNRSEGGSDPDEPVVPDEPAEASHYLYGTISESGTIAISNGEGLDKYQGAVLTPMPAYDKTAYPYATLMKLIYGPYRIVVSTKPCEKKTGSSYDYAINSAVSVLVSDYDKTAGTWGTLNPYTVDTYNMSGIIWTNYDLTKHDGSVLSCPDPIPLVSNEPIRYEGDIPVYEKKE